MKSNSPSGKWRQRPLLFRFLATLYFVICTGSLFSQATLNCDKTQCTSNDVRITSAYISGPGNTSIDCGPGDPFNNAELHLIVSSNTQRVGASVVANLNITANSTVIPISYCFSGQNLNNGANNLTLSLGSSLSGTHCPGGFTLSDQFISWGTGNTNFCTSTAGQCPATPSKCRFKPGEPIPVTVKLDVDFTFTPGLCNEGGNSLAVNFSPVITATNLTAPFTYTWDFGDGTIIGTPISVTDLNSIPDTLHTYASAGNYMVTLTISDNSTTVVTKTGVNSFTLTSCCNLSAPSVTAGPFCSADNKTIADLPQTDGNGGTYHWYSGSDPSNSFELDPSTKLVNGTTYYVSVASGDCESPRTAVTIVVNQTPGAPTVTGPLCAGSTVVSGTSGEADGTTITVSNGATQAGTATVTGGVWSATVTAVSAGDVITATATSSNCSSAPSTPVTVSDNTATPTVIAVCAGATTVTGTNESGASVEVFVNGTSVGAATVSGGNWSKTVSALSSGDVITAIATASGKCASAASAGSSVNPLPSCTISSSGSPTSASLGSPVTFSGPTGPYSYSWGFSSNTSGASFAGGSLTASGATVVVTTTTVGSYTVTLRVTNTLTNCISASTCSYRMTVTPTGPYYTVTQGFYGNTGGKVCMAGVYYAAGTKSSVPGLIEASISNMQNQQLFLGSSGKSFTMGNSATQANSLITIMPGGQTPAKLVGAYNMTSSKYFPPLSKGKIANVFLTQSITMALNISIPGNTLGGFVLNSGYLTTQKINSATCPSTTVLSCSASSSAISSLKITTNNALINWMNGKTVQDLLNLASAVLGGATPPAGVSISDINNAVDVINRSFDGGAVFLGYYPSAKTCASNFNRDMTTATNAINVESVNKLSVTAYPNPFTNKVKFSVISPVSGMASMDLYNIVGQKLKTVYQGYLQAGITQIIEYNVPSPYKGALIYTLKVGDQQVNGKVVQMK